MDINTLKHHNVDGSWSWFHQIGGVAGMGNFFVFDIFSRNMNDNPQIKSIVEIGTAFGFMTLGLGLEATRTRCTIDTFDVQDYTTQGTKSIFMKLDVNHHIMDVFTNHEGFEISQLFNEPVYLICDGGDKAKEFTTFIPLLKSGSIVSVHDYNTEFYDAHWMPLSHLVDPIRQYEWMEKNVQLATFKVK